MRSVRVLLLVSVLLTPLVARGQGPDRTRIEALGMRTAFGVETGDAAAEMGGVQDLAVDENGRMFLLDAKLGRLRLVDRQGRLVAVAGRPGSGPGEFRNPNAIAYDARTRRLFVADQGLGRVSIFTVVADSMSYQGAFPITQFAVDMCVLDGLLILYSPSGQDVPVIVVLTPEGKEVRRFGQGFGAEGGPMLRMAMRGGSVACLPAARMVLLSAQLDPTVSAFNLEGESLWSVRLSGFIPARIRVEKNGYGMDPATPQPWDLADRLFVVGDTMVALQWERRVRPPPSPGRSEPVGRTTVVLSRRGRELWRQEDLPSIVFGAGDLLYSASDDPYPRATVWEYRLRRGR